MSKRGYFISVEGTDGCGKTTQLKLIEDYLKGLGHDVLMLREPGGTLIGEKIRNILLDPENKEMTPETEMYLYAASRAQLVKTVIIPALEEGKIIICDRFLDSSIVYQGTGRKLGYQRVVDVNKNAVSDCMPDMTILLEVDPKIALKRRKEETGLDRVELEGVEFQIKVYNAYKELANMFGDRIKVIDGTKSVDEVFESISYWLTNLIGG